MIKVLRVSAAAACVQILACGMAGAQAAPAEPRAQSLAPQPSPTHPEEVMGHPDPLALLEDDNPALAANKRLAFDMWRSIVNAGHVELADSMLQEGYIQHSPILPTGRAAFKAIFSAIPKREIPAVVSPALVTILAEGDLVVMALREEMPEPSGQGSYSTVHFNLFRVEDQRLAEHWHSVQEAPGANVLPPDKGGPQRVTGLSGPAQLALLQDGDATLAANKKLVFDAWRHIHDAGRTDLAGTYFSPGFINHDPTPEPRAGQPLEPYLRSPIVAMVAQGDLVVLVTGLEHPHPLRQGETYTTTWFDMFRIADGKIAEHWNCAVKPGTPQPKYGD
ncbi:MAG: hypothetical protein BGO57_07520 [Sphingomonadales bacterium 63-6]|nr:MAG: hypothetical protein BGO57_07520 [Sphingomonadales bacterium 63-6]